MAGAKITEHPDRGRIEHDLAAGVSVRAIAKKYKGVNIKQLYRLRTKLPPQLKAKAMAKRLKAGVDLEQLRLDESEGILQNLSMQRCRLLVCQDHAIDTGDIMAAGHLSGHIHRNIELVGKYLGEFAQHQIKTTISILIQPEYLELRAALMRALAPFPDARHSVATALHVIEARAVDVPSSEGAHVAA
jgi:hypothetical protein